MSKSDAFWDKTAESYAKKPVPDEALYQKKLSETQSFLSPDMRILEFGCGTGTTAVHHAPYVSHIDALDISENMLEIGRVRAKDANVENITFTRKTLTEFKADEKSLDAVLGLNVIHLLPNRQEELAEVVRILKPGGVFVSSTACLGNSFMRFIKLFSPLGKRLGIMPDVFIVSEDELVNEMKNYGLTIEQQWHYGPQNIEVFIIAKAPE